MKKNYKIPLFYEISAEEFTGLIMECHEIKNSCCSCKSCK
jgi:hypothetical protein